MGSTSATPVLSILIPTFRRPQALQRAIASVQANGLAESYEVIISDDDPEGSAKPIVEAFQDARLRYTTPQGRPNKPANWQHGIEQTRGTFCFKLDDDDQIAPGFLSKMLTLLQSHPYITSAYPAFREVFATETMSHDVIDEVFFGPTGVISGEKYIRGVLLNEGGFPKNQKTTVVFRRKAAELIGFYQHACDDFSFGAALALTGDVGYLPEPLYWWSRHEANSSHDLQAVWQLAHQSLKGLATLKAGKNHPQLGSYWESMVDQCRQALPYYYLHAALRLHGRSAAWQLYHHFQEQNALDAPRKAWALTALGSLLPQGLVETVFHKYQQSPWGQKLARTFLFPASFKGKN